MIKKKQTTKMNEEIDFAPISFESSHAYVKAGEFTSSSYTCTVDHQNETHVFLSEKGSEQKIGEEDIGEVFYTLSY